MRGIRNNNPGNIRHDGKCWQGERTPSTDRSFKQFVSMAYGYRAMLLLLRNYITLRQVNTIETMVARWAPATENDTESYIVSVEKQTGISHTQPLDANDRERLMLIAAAISRVENGVTASVPEIAEGWRLLSL